MEQYRDDGAGWVADHSDYSQYDLDWDNVEEPGVNAKQKCLAARETSADEDIKTAQVESGVWYEKSTGRVEFNRAEWEIDFRAPSAIAATETQVQGQLTANADLSFTDDSGNTVNAAAAQSVYIGYEVIEDLDSPNLLGFFFNLDVPSDLVAQNDTLIYQYASFRKEFTFGEWNTVACVTRVGNDTAA